MSLHPAASAANGDTMETEIGSRDGCNSIMSSGKCRTVMILSLAVASPCLPAVALTFEVGVSSIPSSSFTSSSQSMFPLNAMRSSDLYCHERTYGRAKPASSLTMKVSGSNKRSRSSKSSHLIELNNERLTTAGRPGTKKFLDPNKVFIGNLPYDATEDDVYQLFSRHWNVPLESVGDRVESIKIIRDWKTGQSKGYGFMQFYEPMVATSAMESVNKGKGGGWRIKGRRIRLDQGKRNEDEQEERRRMKKKKKLEIADLDEEGLVIHSALEDVEARSGGVESGGTLASDVEEDGDDEDGLGMSEDDMITFMEKGGLRGVMPLTEETAGFLGIEGLYDGDDEYDEGFYQEHYNENGYEDGDFGDVDEDDDEDGEELVYDGVFEEMYNPNEYEGMGEEEEENMKKMNREQRRSAEKKRKKRKLPFKGFGSP